MPSGAAPRRARLGRPSYGIVWIVHRSGDSLLVASALVDASSLLSVRSRGGRGRRAASALRLRHLAPDN
ncbi:hypothetical protein NDU88_011323 [Pleurodeles waltl]|uniref:Uncharacterized protein n=1 Tax=Pleurodeles waltl TaxID=8319 RepID=A0AAV7R124_PLEWA|nr:hypothetical protein NDU88_011323 [Pleurodeles waltl]